jgi:hypothetical protein
MGRWHARTIMMAGLFRPLDASTKSLHGRVLAGAVDAIGVRVYAMHNMQVKDLAPKREGK